MNNSTIKSVRSRLLSGAALSCALTLTSPVAFAEEAGESHFVTGSRLDVSDSAVTPAVLEIGGDEIRTLGYSRVEDMLNTLPQIFAAETTQESQQFSGTSQIDLRGLGAERTLVLIDGKRLPYGSPQSPAHNLDFVPAQLVERIEIRNGGGSAVYGAGAIGGTVNFRLRRDFEGIEFDGNVGFHHDENNNDFANALLDASGINTPGARRDGRNTQASILFGVNTADGRGNVTAFLGYQNQNAIRADARDHSTCAYGGATPGPSSIGGVTCVGSSNFRQYIAGRILFLTDDGTFVRRSFDALEQRYNFAADVFTQHPVERFNATVFATYEIAEKVEAYLDLSFLDNTTTDQLAPSATFFRSFEVNCDNPFLTAPVAEGGVFRDALGCTPSQVAAGEDVPLFASYRNVEGDPRRTTIENTSWMISGGLRGDLAGNWRWDAYGQFARVEETQLRLNDLNFERVQDALFAVSDGMGGAVCRSGNANCAPYNIFQRPGGQSQVTDAAVDYIQGVGIENGVTELKVLSASLQGDLGDYGIQFPWASRGVQVLAGGEWREELLEITPDDISQISNGIGFTGVGGGSMPIAGGIRVADVFME